MRNRLTRFVVLILVIEFLDEFVFGAREAAWPLIRDDLALTYAQVGLLLSVPNLFANIVEPFLAVLGDVWRRRVIVLGGGVVYAAALLASAAAGSFAPLLLAFVLLYPASGAFVSLSQATLMDIEPERHEQNMARWTVAGSVGVVLGPLLLGAATLVGFGWRGMLLLLGLLTVIVLVFAWRMPYPDGATSGQRLDFWIVWRGLRDALVALRNRRVLKWLVLLEFSDFQLDILLGFLALYFVDIGGATPAEAGLAVAAKTGAGLLGDFLLIPLLERVRGVRYLRVSVLIVLLLYPVFLLVPGFWPKIVILVLLGFLDAGWYAIPQARLYSALPGQSGTVLAIKNVSGLIAGFIPLVLGLVAQGWGLQVAMWLLLAGPVVLLLGVWNVAVME